MTDSQAAEAILIISDTELPLDREQFPDPPFFIWTPLLIDI